MRVESAATAKGRTPHTQLAPVEGTLLRTLWDQFKAAPAQPIAPSIYSKLNVLGTALEQLRNFYGLDIRAYHESHKVGAVGHGGRARSRYWLVGEWFGKTYIDYVADRRAQEERAARRSA